MSDFLSARLRERVAEKPPLVVPGAADALAALIIADIGFEAIYVTGAGVANSSLGMPDLGFLTLSELATEVEAIRESIDIPLIVDADTGFGGPLQVQRTVRALERRGANAIQLEDQTFPKRCGHFPHKEVIPTGEMVAKLHAAADARQDQNLLLIARTDAIDSLGIEESIDRAEQYREAGADVIFVEAPRTLEDIKRLGEVVKGPKLINIVEGGLTPLFTADELGSFGFSIVLYANTALRAAIYGMQKALAELHATGSTAGAVQWISSWEERQRLVRTHEFEDKERRYGTE